MNIEEITYLFTHISIFLYIYKHDISIKQYMYKHNLIYAQFV